MSVKHEQEGKVAIHECGHRQLPSSRRLSPHRNNSSTISFPGHGLITVTLFSGSSKSAGVTQRKEVRNRMMDMIDSIWQRVQQADPLPAYIAFATQSGRGLIAVNTVAFMLAVATMFSLLVVSASAAGRLLIQSQNPSLVINSAVVTAFTVVSFLGIGFRSLGRATSSAPETPARGSFAFAPIVARIRTYS